MKKQRLDQLLVNQHMLESRAFAQRVIMAGQVKVNDQVVLKPATMVAPDATVTIEKGPKYVSRGGEKLEAALQQFNLTNLHGQVCADVGSSTGGFTDCLLAHGAIKVYAVDVGHGILHWKLRKDPRVVSYEKTNVRNLSFLPEKVDLITVDVSFISLAKIIPVIRNWFMDQGGIVIALIKPQFEAGKEEAARGKGVIRDKTVHSKVLNNVLHQIAAQQFGILDLMQSPLLGPKGNKEFLVHVEYPQKTLADLPALVKRVLG